MSQALLPIELLYAGSIAGLVAAVIQIIYFLAKVISIPRLDVTLTKEVFFRFSELGECLFSHPVLIARHGTVEVRKVRFELKKISPHKNFNLSVLWFGEKKHSDGPYADNHFFSQSSICFVPKDTPMRPVYLTVLDVYAEKIKNVVEEFRIAMTNVNRKYTEHSQLDASSAVYKDSAKKIIEEFVNATSDAEKKIYDNLQIEEGDYELKILVDYHVTLFQRKFLRTSSSSIKFMVSGFARNLIKSGMSNTLNTSGRNIAFNKTDIYSYPQYVPESIQEVE